MKTCALPKSVGFLSTDNYRPVHVSKNVQISSCAADNQLIFVCQSKKNSFKNKEIKAYLLFCTIHIYSLHHAVDYIYRTHILFRKAFFVLVKNR